MLADDEIATLFRVPESERLERKSVLAADRIRDAICAFANDLAGHRAPGLVIVGQNDDLTCANLRIDETLLRSLGQYSSDGQIMPFPNLSVRALEVDGCRFAAVVVMPSTNTPVRRNGRVKVRVGPTTRDASAEEERRLLEKRVWATLPFDAQPVSGATVDDLDLVRFRGEYLPAAVSPEALAENRRTIRQQLGALRLARPDGTPTPTGLLVVGKVPQDWLPGAYVQFIRFAGAGDTDPIIDQKRIDGTLGDQVRRLDELAAIHNAAPLTLVGERHRITPDYPEAALRQTLRNALMHRTYDGSNAPVRLAWYADRVEVVSPGGPYGQITPDNFGAVGLTDYRNPTIAEAMRTLGLVERFGIGLQIIRASMRDNGNPPPEFVATHTHVVVRLRRREQPGPAV